MKIGLEEGKLALTQELREAVKEAWNKLELHDRSIKQFDQAYSSRWGNPFFGRTKGEPAQAAIVQKLKLSKRYSPAHHVDARKNRFVYCVVKELWLHSTLVGKARACHHKTVIAKVYQRLQQRVTVDDPELAKLGIPLLKLNNKCIAEFIRRQQALSGENVTDQGANILKRHQSVAVCADRPAAMSLPEERPRPVNRPAV